MTPRRVLGADRGAGTIRRRLGIGAAGLLLATLLSASSDLSVAAAPGGPRLAFQKLDRGASTMEILTTNPAGGERYPITGGSRRTYEPLPEFGFAPAWSPDGKLLVFGGHAGRGTQLFLVRAKGGRARAIPRTRGAFSPVFAADGRTVAFARARIRGHVGFDKDGTPNISSYTSVTTWTMEIDGSHLRRLTPWRNGLEITPSSFSPDGGILAVSRFDERDLSTDALALRTDGSGSFLLASDALRPAYSPDGSHIALFVHLAHADPGLGSYGFYRGGLTVMRADGTEPRRLARSSFYEQSPPSWDPSGERLAYAEGTSVMEINADGSCRRKVFARTAKLLYFGPAWQPGPSRTAGRIAC